jgi:6-phosphogluconolactonase
MHSCLRIILLILGLSVAGLGATAPVRLVPRFAYVTNGLDDTISIFAIERARLRAVGYVYVGLGSNPGQIAITPSQKFLYVSSRKSGVYGFSVDAIVGTLTPIPGSPFATGSTSSITITPSEHYLITAGGNGVLSYSIDPSSGVLTRAGSATTQNVVAIGMDPKALFIYAVDASANNISGFVINDTNGGFSAVAGSTFAVGTNPQAIVMDPFGKFLYVPNGNSANVSAFAINPKTGMLSEVTGSPFAAGLNPVSAALTHSGKFLYVGNSADKTVSQYAVNRTSGSLVSVAQPFSTGTSGPLGLVVSPTQQLLYVADHDSSEVAVLGLTREGVLFNESSIRSRGPATAIALASGISAISYSPKFLYESNVISDDVWGYRVGASTGSLSELVSSPFATGKSPMTIAADLTGKFVYTANSVDGKISGFAVNAQTGVLTSVPGSPFSAGAQAFGIAVDANAHHVYVTHPTLNKISGFTVSLNGSLTPLRGSPFADDGSNPEALTIDPRGRVLYVANTKSNTVSIYNIDPRTGILTHLGSIATGTLPIALAINPEGKFLYTLDQTSFKLSCFAIDGITGLLSALPDPPSFGTISLDSISIDPQGHRMYAVGMSDATEYTIFGGNGRLKLVSSFPSADLAGASSSVVDLSDSFLYVANSTDNSVSVFTINKTTGSIAPSSSSPFGAGNGPGSVTVVNSFE